MEQTQPDMGKLGTLDRYVLDIYEKLRMYERIVKTTLGDMVPKAITLYIIKELRKFIDSDLWVLTLASSNDYVSISRNYL